MPNNRFAQALEFYLGKEEAERLSADAYMVTGVPLSWSKGAVVESIRHLHWECHVQDRPFFDPSTRTRTWICRANHAPVQTRIQTGDGGLIHIRKPAPRQANTTKPPTVPVRKWLGPTPASRTAPTPAIWSKQPVPPRVFGPPAGPANQQRQANQAAKRPAEAVDDRAPMEGHEHNQQPPPPNQQPNRNAGAPGSSAASSQVGAIAGAGVALTPTQGPPLAVVA